MIKNQLLQRVVVVLLAVLAVGSVSLFADERPDFGTELIQSDRYRGGRGSDLEGVVVWVNPNGDDFVLRTRGQELRIDARGGVVAFYQGRRYRIRDLERGDRILVDLASTRSGRPRARSVEVIESISDRGYGRDRRSDDRYNRRDRNRDGRHSRDRHDFVRGSIVSFNSGRNVVLLRTESGGDISVDTSRLRYDWTQGLRGGEWVEFQGYYSGRVFIADSVSGERNRDRYRNDDWRGRGW